ncbi:hypothetical protein G3T36_16285 [Diaminobutyricibacter tongyongensis]|uniref:Hemagglutinin n=1 Tax=Leifsonia tongyongensis TaxID=1268043 RepID=A0A6L9Y145_9MICO|nr:hypothetical protein [Diaminobutyricibacter tongyongensis]NEN07419.1 hypothetical protein [Diaminobutyricibacter tongyongensis]
MGLRGRAATIVGASAAAIAVVVTLFAAPAAAASDPPFHPGLIISDDTFYNYQSMSARDIQAFLEARTCKPKDTSPCLADYSADSRSIPDQGAGHCDAITGRRNEAASSIIERVAVACGINPQVLLVLLQKEQSLLTAPSASGYAKATGYACPDTAACDKKYLGFFNQVYRAAWQFREYTLHPGEWHYRIGRVPVQYHPDAACGSSTVHIADQATANLYNYTPYQPNAETLAHPKGPAGSCSTFGNLNFSRIFNQWFGSPLTVRFPGILPACLNFVGGQDCPSDQPFDFAAMASGR